MSNNKYRVLQLALVPALAGSAAALEAAEWVAEPSVKLLGEYNDNVRLTTVQPDSTWGAILEPRLSLARRTERGDLSAIGRLKASQYTEENAPDSLNSYFDVAGNRRFLRGSVGASASYVNDTTLQNETLDFDTGVTVNEINRTITSGRLNGQYTITEANWLEGSVSYSTTDYDNGEQYGLLDYDYLTSTLRLVHRLNERTQVFGVYTHSDVDYDTSTDLESKTDSLQLGMAHEFTQTWSVSGSIGSRRTETSSIVPTAIPRPGLEIFYPAIFDLVYQPRDNETTGLVYEASVTREFETGSLQLAGSRSVTPSSTGTDAETTSIVFTATRDFTAKLSTQLAVSYFQSSTVGDVTTRSDVDRFRVAPSLNWRVDEELSLTAGYTYTRIERELGADNTADSNRVFVGLNYVWPRIAVSR